MVFIVNSITAIVALCYLIRLQKSKAMIHILVSIYAPVDPVSGFLIFRDMNTSEKLFSSSPIVVALDSHTVKAEILVGVIDNSEYHRIFTSTDSNFNKCTTARKNEVYLLSL